jgi:hypothetical protein
MGQCPFFDQVLDFGPVKSTCNNFVEPISNLLALAVPHSLNQKLPKRAAFELDLTENVKDLATQGFSGFFQFIEKGAVNRALAGLIGQKIPQVANLGLANSVNTPKTLLDAVGIPR